MEIKRGATFLTITFREGVSKANAITLFMICFFAMFMNIGPAMITPIYLQEVIGISLQHTGKINASLSVLGEIITILLVGAVGVLSDKTGRRILMIIGFSVSALMVFLFGSSHLISDLIGIEQDLILVFIFRTFLGVSLILVWPQIQPLVTDYTYIAGRGKAMAAMGFMYVASALFSFLFVARLPKLIGIYNVFLFIVAFAILSSLVSKVWLIDVMEKKPKEKIKWKEVFSLLKKSTCTRISFLSAFTARADVVILAMFIMVWVNKVAAEYGKTPAEAMAEGGLTIGMSSIVGLLLYPVWGQLVEKWGRLKVLVLGLIFAGSGYSLIFFVTNPFSIWMKVCVLIFSLGVNGATVGASTLAADVSPRNIIGSVLGGYHTASALGIMFFLQIGGIFFDHVGHSYPFVLTGVADLIVMIYILFSWKKASIEEKNLKEIK